MSASTVIKKNIIQKVSGTSLINKVYSYEKLNPDGYPCAFVTVTGVDNEFHSTAENKRVYGYRVLVLCQIGQDQTNTKALEQAEDQIQQVLAQIIDAMDNDITLGALGVVIFVEASVGEFGYVETEAGWARSAEILIRVHSIFTVNQ